MRSPLVIGNWKLNGSKALTKQLIQDLKTELAEVQGCKIAIAPPAVYLDLAHTLLADSAIELGAQNVDINSSGAYTGEVSAGMLKDIGAKYIIIGHSERRTGHREQDEIIAGKFAMLKQAALIPVLCIGETEEENAAGKTEQVCMRQLDAVIKLVGIAVFSNAIIAYEPVWAIGTGKSASPTQAQAVHDLIRNHLAGYDKRIAEQIVIQYGGSVNEKNAAELFAQPDIDGALVGGASLKPDAFANIVKAAAQAQLC